MLHCWWVNDNHRGKEAADKDDAAHRERHRCYWIIMVSLVSEALLILSCLVNNVGGIVDSAAGAAALTGFAVSYLYVRLF